MMKNTILKGFAAVAIAGALALSATSVASAETLSATPTIAATSANGGVVGSGYIDVSTLSIAGTINPATGEITAVTPYSPAPLKPTAGHASPQTTMPACQGRKDYYRIIDTSGYQRCFAYSGTYALSSGYWTQIQYLCPGNNRGRTEYVNGSTNTWSVWRGAETNFDTCYSFGGTPVPAFAVQIA